MRRPARPSGFGHRRRPSDNRRRFPLHLSQTGWEAVMFMRFPPCPAMGRPEIGPLWANVEAVFTRERAENGDMPECGPYLRFQAPNIFRVQRIDRTQVLATHRAAVFPTPPAALDGTLRGAGGRRVTARSRDTPGKTGGYHRAGNRRAEGREGRRPLPSTGDWVRAVAAPATSAGGGVVVLGAAAPEPVRQGCGSVHRRWDRRCRHRTGGADRGNSRARTGR